MYLKRKQERLSCWGVGIELKAIGRCLWCWEELDPVNRNFILLSRQSETTIVATELFGESVITGIPSVLIRNKSFRLLRSQFIVCSRPIWMLLLWLVRHDWYAISAHDHFDIWQWFAFRWPLFGTRNIHCTVTRRTGTLDVTVGTQRERATRETLLAVTRRRSEQKESSKRSDKWD